MPPKAPINNDFNIRGSAVGNAPRAPFGGSNKNIFSPESANGDIKGATGSPSAGPHNKENTGMGVVPPSPSMGHMAPRAQTQNQYGQPGFGTSPSHAALPHHQHHVTHVQDLNLPQNFGTKTTPPVAPSAPKNPLMMGYNGLQLQPKPPQPQPANPQQPLAQRSLVHDFTTPHQSPPDQLSHQHFQQQVHHSPTTFNPSAQNNYANPLLPPRSSNTPNSSSYGNQYAPSNNFQGGASLQLQQQSSLTARDSQVQSASRKDSNPLQGGFNDNYQNESPNLASKKPATQTERFNPLKTVPTFQKRNDKR